MKRLKTYIGNVITYDTGSEHIVTKVIYLSRPDPTKDYVFDSGMKRRITRKIRGTEYKVVGIEVPEGQTTPVLNQEALKLLINADLIMFVPDYATSEICVLEHKICETYNLQYIDL